MTAAADIGLDGLRIEKVAGLAQAPGTDTP